MHQTCYASRWSYDGGRTTGSVGERGCKLATRLGGRTTYGGRTTGSVGERAGGGDGGVNGTIADCN